MAGKMVKFSMAFKMTPKNVTNAVRAASAGRLMKAALTVEKTAKVLVSVGGGRDHEPSAAGDPPHVQTGNLRSSIRTEVLTPIQVVVGPTVYYGKYLEYGTRHMAKRPFMRPALLDSMALIPNLFRRLW